jgi:hypothetical protein
MLLFAIPAWEMGPPRSTYLFLALILLLGIFWLLIGRHYERRFGHVQAWTLPWYWGYGQSPVRQGLFWIATILVSLAAARMLDMSVFTSGWLLGCIFAGFFVLEDRPWYYLPFALLFLVLAVLNRTPHHSLLLLEVWLLPFAFIITGLLDHWVLVRALPGAPANGNVGS